MLSNNQVYEKISQAIQARAKQTNIFALFSTTIRVTDLFPKEVKEGKLALNNVDFFRLGPDLSRLDFTGCTFYKCNFSHLTIRSCVFDDSNLVTNNNFSDCFIKNDNRGIEPTNKKKEEQDVKESDNKSSVSGSHLGFWSTPQGDIDYSYNIYDYDNDPDKHNRTMRCWEQRCLKYPEDFLKYDNISFINNDQYMGRDCPMRDERSGFIVFSYPYDQIALEKMELPSFNEGWKLHISIDRKDDNMKKAFDLLAPFLAKQGYLFKFTIPQFERSGRMFVNIQMTIYLNKNDKESLPPDQVYNLMMKINQILEDNHVNPAISIPNSDAPTFSKYLSMRNDRYGLPESLGRCRESLHISSFETGHNYNPCGYPNPYKYLLKVDDKPFDMLDHFLRFNVEQKGRNIDIALDALLYTMIAYLKEYSFFDTLDEKEMKVFLSRCIDKDARLDDRFIKEKSRDGEDIQQNIKIAFLLVDYLSDPNITRVEPHDFSAHFPAGSQFIIKLKKIEDIISKIVDRNHDDSFTKCSKVTFSEYLSDSRIRLEAKKQVLESKKEALAAKRKELEARKKQFEANKKLADKKQELIIRRQQLEAKKRQLDATKQQSSQSKLPTSESPKKIINR